MGVVKVAGTGYGLACFPSFLLFTISLPLSFNTSLVLT